MNQPRITKITVGRLYNLGNYEHIRYELCVEVPEGASAATAITAIEKILTGCAPLKGIPQQWELDRDARAIERMKSMTDEDWQREHAYSVGTRDEIIARYQQQLDKDIAKAKAATEQARKARALFDDLGGAAEWKDAKRDWEDYDEDL